jgi:hypothetical protein
MKIKSKIQLAMWAILFMATIPLSAYAADGQIKIAQTPSTTFPIVIDKPGSYVLTSNILADDSAANVIEITADNVTLDFNGHALICQMNGPVGIFASASNRHNIIIENGTVTGCDRGVEIYYGNIYGIQIKNMNVSDNRGPRGEGILTTNAIISNCTANNNASSGIRCSYCTITNCTANNNSGTGGNSGIYANFSVVTNCIANGNHSYLAGIQGGGSIITNCIATGNDYSGIEAGDDSRVESNNTRNNGKYGLDLGGSHIYAIKNTASGNPGGNFNNPYPTNNYMPTTGDNANVGW